MWRLPLAVIALALFLPADAQAQELPTAHKYENVGWLMVRHVAYKPGQRNAALAIIREHFKPAADAAGLEPPKVLEHQTGSWDITLIWPLLEGPADLEWEINPWQEQWWVAFVEREGDAATGIREEYFSKIARTTSSVVIDRDVE